MAGFAGSYWFCAALGSHVRGHLSYYHVRCCAVQHSLLPAHIIKHPPAKCRLETGLPASLRPVAFGPGPRGTNNNRYHQRNPTTQCIVTKVLYLTGASSALEPQAPSAWLASGPSNARSVSCGESEAIHVSTRTPPVVPVLYVVCMYQGTVKYHGTTYVVQYVRGIVRGTAATTVAVGRKRRGSR